MTETKEVTQREWSAALRSGDYIQTFYTLHKGDADGGPICYCALGVLLHCVNPDIYIGKLATVIVDDDGYPSWLDERSWADTVVLNDVKGLSFPEIADWIDEGMPTGDNND